jgi:predicted hydrocarbon binding protein
MPVKDKVVTWYIQNIIIPRREIIDRPGFIVTTFTENKFTTYLREFFLPELLFEIIENKIVQQYGEQGKQALYSAGKKFGYLYASMSNFPSVKDTAEKELSQFAYLFIRYCEGVFSSKANHNLNIDKKEFKISFNDYIICRHNGLGQVMAEGGSAGIWSYIMQDKNIEGIQTECQGRGDNRCAILCAPREKIEKITNKLFIEADILDQTFDTNYKALNEIRETKFAQNSLQNLINHGFFDFRHGILSYKNLRFFPAESHLLYIIENEIMKLKGGEKCLFDACYEFGKKLQQIYGESDYQKFILDFFPSIGFGEIRELDKEKLVIAAIYYPWTVFSMTSKYIILRGMLSGFISGSLNEKIELKNYDVDIKSYLTFTMSL